MTLFERARISLANPSRSSQAEIEQIMVLLGGCHAFGPNFSWGIKSSLLIFLFLLGNNIYVSPFPFSQM
jgi:hypothetical protein